jgi:hypothetical protein
MDAIINNDLARATHLLNGGLDPNFGQNKVSLSFSRSQGEREKMPPLYAAIDFSSEQMVAILLEHSSNPNTPLSIGPGLSLRFYSDALSYLISTASLVYMGKPELNDVFSQKHFNMYVALRQKMQANPCTHNTIEQSTHPTLVACRDWEQAQRIEQNLNKMGAPTIQKIRKI